MRKALQLTGADRLIAIEAAEPTGSGSGAGPPQGLSWRRGPLWVRSTKSLATSPSLRFSR